MKQLVQTTKETIGGLLDRLQEMVMSADENGLFKDDSCTYKNILDDICDAYKQLGQDELIALKKFSLACNKFNQIVNSSSFWWRFKFSYGGPVVLYYVAISISIFLAWTFFSDVIFDSKIMSVPSWAYLWGLMGGVLQGIWSLWQHVSDRRLRKHWFTWLFSLPLMGAILGALTYLIFLAGFVVSTGEAQIKSEFFVMLLSALAGFISEWAVEMLNKLTNIIQIRG